MFCPMCGMKNNDENLWCIKCGINLEQLTSANEPAPETVNPEPVFEATSDAAECACDAAPIADAEPVTVYTEPEVKQGEKPKAVKDHLVWSILAAIFGSIIFGTVAVIFSGLVQTERGTGDIQKAESYSSKAKLFCIIATSIGIAKAIFIVLLIAFIVAVAFLPFLFY